MAKKKSEQTTDQTALELIDSQSTEGVFRALRGIGMTDRDVVNLLALGMTSGSISEKDGFWTVAH